MRSFVCQDWASFDRAEKALIVNSLRVVSKFMDMESCGWGPKLCLLPDEGLFHTIVGRSDIQLEIDNKIDRFTLSGGPGEIKPWKNSGNEVIPSKLNAPTDLYRDRPYLHR